MGFVALWVEFPEAGSGSATLQTIQQISVVQGLAALDTLNLKL